MVNIVLPHYCTHTHMRFSGRDVVPITLHYVPLCPVQAAGSHPTHAHISILPPLPFPKQSLSLHWVSSSEEQAFLIPSWDLQSGAVVPLAKSQTRKAEACWRTYYS